MMINLDRYTDYFQTLMWAAAVIYGFKICLSYPYNRFMYSVQGAAFALLLGNVFWSFYRLILSDYPAAFSPSELCWMGTFCFLCVAENEYNTAGMRHKPVSSRKVKAASYAGVICAVTVMLFCVYKLIKDDYPVYPYFIEIVPIAFLGFFSFKGVAEMRFKSFYHNSVAAFFICEQLMYISSSYDLNIHYGLYNFILTFIVLAIVISAGREVKRSAA